LEIKGQLDATDWFLLQNLLFTQHVSGTIMPIIRSSRFIQMVAACGTWHFGLHRGGVRSTRGLGPTMTARGQSIGILTGMLLQTLIISRLDQLSRLCTWI